MKPKTPIVLAEAQAAEHWAAEMDRAADVVADAGAGVAIVDGNRAIATTLRNCAKLLRDLVDGDGEDGR